MKKSNLSTEKDNVNIATNDNTSIEYRVKNKIEFKKKINLNILSTNKQYVNKYHQIIHSKPKKNEINTAENQKKKPSSYFKIMKEIIKNKEEYIIKDNNINHKIQYNNVMDEIFKKFSNDLNKYIDENQNNIKLIGNKVLFKEMSPKYYLEKLCNIDHEKILTPIPFKSINDMKNKLEKEEYDRVERSAVIMRRVEYAMTIISKFFKENQQLFVDKNNVQKQNNPYLNSLIKIQIWWRGTLKIILLKRKKRWRCFFHLFYTIYHRIKNKKTVMCNLIKIIYRRLTLHFKSHKTSFIKNLKKIKDNKKNNYFESLINKNKKNSFYNIKVCKSRFPIKIVKLIQSNIRTYMNSINLNKNTKLRIKNIFKSSKITKIVVNRIIYNNKNIFNIQNHFIKNILINENNFQIENKITLVKIKIVHNCFKIKKNLFNVEKFLIKIQRFYKLKSRTCMNYVKKRFMNFRKNCKIRKVNVNSVESVISRIIKIQKNYKFRYNKILKYDDKFNSNKFPIKTFYKPFHIECFTKKYLSKNFSKNIKKLQLAFKNYISSNFRKPLIILKTVKFVYFTKIITSKEFLSLDESFKKSKIIKKDFEELEETGLNETLETMKKENKLKDAEDTLLAEELHTIRIKKETVILNIINAYFTIDKISSCYITKINKKSKTKIFQKEKNLDSVYYVKNYKNLNFLKKIKVIRRNTDKGLTIMSSIMTNKDKIKFQNCMLNLIMIYKKKLKYDEFAREFTRIIYVKLLSRFFYKFILHSFFKNDIRKKLLDILTRGKFNQHNNLINKIISISNKDCSIEDNYLFDDYINDIVKLNKDDIILDFTNQNFKFLNELDVEDVDESVSEYSICFKCNCVDSNKCNCDCHITNASSEPKLPQIKKMNIKYRLSKLNEEVPESKDIFESIKNKNQSLKLFNIFDIPHNLKEYNMDLKDYSIDDSELIDNKIADIKKYSNETFRNKSSSVLKNNKHPLNILKNGRNSVSNNQPLIRYNS